MIFFRNNWFSILLFFTITFISIYARSYDIETFISETDDHIVAVAILQAKEPINYNSVLASIHDTSKSTYNSFAKTYLRKLEARGKLTDFINLIAPLRRYFCVPNQTTYAPFQFLFTHFLVNKNQSLRQMLFWGRLPSLIFSILSMLLFYIIIFRAFIDYDKYAFLLSYAIFSFSLESIIYSKQMESYSIGIFAILLLLLMLITFLKRSDFDDIYIFVKLGLGFGFLILMQYQMLFFIFPAFVIMFCRMVAPIGPGSISSSLKKIVLSGFVFLVFFAPLYLLFLSKHTQHINGHWNNGPNNEFLFSGFKQESLWNSMKYFLAFFWNNSISVFSNNVSFIPNGYSLSFFSGILSFVLIPIAFYGFYQMFRKPDKLMFYLGVFIGICLLVWFILVLTGRLSLSPTRHSLILLPIFCILIYIGLSMMNQWEKSKSILSAFYLSITVFTLIAFTYSFRRFFDSRREIFTDVNFINNIKSYDFDCIVSNDYELVGLIPELRNNCDIFLLSDFNSNQRWISTGTKKVYRRIGLINIEPSSDKLKKINHLINNDAFGHQLDLKTGFDVKSISTTVTSSDELSASFPRLVSIKIAMVDL